MAARWAFQWVDGEVTLGERSVNLGSGVRTWRRVELIVTHARPILLQPSVIMTVRRRDPLMADPRAPPAESGVRSVMP